MKWPVCPSQEFWNGEKRLILISGTAVLVVKHKDQIRAFDNRCPHQKASLYEGTFKNGVVTCPNHHWQFDALNGHGLNPENSCLKSFPVEIVDQMIYVLIEQEAEV